MDDAHEDPGPPSSPLPSLLVALAAIAVFLSGAARALTVSLEAFVTRYTHDDAYYYFQVARNTARGIGPSFDGLEWTNGFSPVWGATLVPVFALFEEGELAARAATVLGLSLYCVGLALFERALRPTFGAWPSALATIAALGSGARDVALTGMDFPLNLFFEALLVLAFVRVRGAATPVRLGLALAVGALAGVTCVQRPDTGLLPVLLTLPLFLTRDGLRTALLLVAGALAVAVPYFVASYLTFGTPMPVSGKLKTFNANEARARDGLAPCVEAGAFVLATAPLHPTTTALGGSATRVEQLSQGARHGLLGATAALALVGAGAALRRRRREAPSVGVAVPILAAGFLHTGVAALFLFPYVHYGNWYFAPELLAGTVLTAGALSALARLLPARLRGTAGVVAAVLAGAAFVHDELREWRAPEPPADQVEVVSLRVAEHLASEIGRDANVGVFNAGRVAYFADVHVVNLDGLINTNAFAEEVWMSSKGSFGMRFLRYALDKELAWFCDTWDVPMQMVATYFPPKLRPFFTLVESWPTRTTFLAERPGNYELVRLDLDGLRAAIAAAEAASSPEEGE